MAKTLFDDAARLGLTARIRGLTPANVRRWGRMTLGQALPHMADQLRMGLGVIKSGPPHGPLRFSATRYLLIHVVPWPKGPKGPAEAFTSATGGFEQDVQALTALIEEFGRRDPKAEWPAHPLFGQLTGRDWGVLSHKHLDHHLRQFSA